jgi:hypothetical protein
LKIKGAGYVRPIQPGNAKFQSKAGMSLIISWIGIQCRPIPVCWQRRKMEIRNWKFENRNSKVETRKNCRSQIANHQSQITNHQSPIANNKSQM